MGSENDGGASQPSTRAGGRFWGRLRNRVLVYVVCFALAWLAIWLMIVNPTLDERSTTLADPQLKVALRRHVETLAGIQPPRQEAHVDSLDRAAAYIRAELQSYGYDVRDQAYKVGDRTYRNLIAEIESAPGARAKDHEKLLVIGAHYDVAGDQPGADDNASGVAGLLEVARLAKAPGAGPRRRVRFVAYTLEEPPHFETEQMGSFVHSRSLKDAGVELKAMLSLEMIGYFKSEPGSQSFPIRGLNLLYPDTGDFIAIIGQFGDWRFVRSIKRLMQAKSAVDVRSMNAPSFVQGIDFSDHANYWRLGYPAVMITDTAFFRNANYHKATDTVDTLDFEKMAEVVSGVHAVVRGL